MSFLAQLRRKPSDSPTTGLQLCYSLSLEQQQISLALYLVTLINGEWTGGQQAYRIQRQHLQQPPPFMTSNDVAILDLLLRHSEHWLHNYCSIFAQFESPTQSAALLSQILDSDKCFTQKRAKVWQKLVKGNLQEAQPQWRVHADGSQQLSWQTSEALHLWMLADEPWFYRAQQGQLSPARVNLTADALETFKTQQKLPFDAINSFINEHKTQWTRLGLPLPEPPSVKHLTVEIEPVLLCRLMVNAQGQQHDELCLQFRYSTEHVCFLRTPEQEAERQTIWNGREVLLMALDRKQEVLWMQRLSGFIKKLQTTANECIWQSSDKAAWKRLLLTDRRKLETLGSCFAFDAGFKHHYVAPEDWQVQLQQAGENQWQLALSFIADGQKVDVFDLLKQLRTFNQNLSNSSVELQWGSQILVLSGNQIGSLSDELGDLLEQQGNDALLPLNQLYRLNGLKRHLPENTFWQGGQALQQQAINLQSSPIMLDRNSCDVQAQLRPYQWLGICWLQHLTNIGCHGLLADDMGLGKTLQTLGHLSLEKKAGRLQNAVALIVAPTSLLSNWLNELQRFCPQLSVHVLHGQDRHQWWQKKANVDVVITSYPLVARDIDYWREVPISWLILDEAQVIKNPRTQISKAVKDLQAKHRLCLSGTPVENHLSELWSLLDFLAPGILGSQKQFKHYFQKPIEQEGQQQRLQQLLDRIAPYMLRRTKQQVAQDLPAKTIVQQTIALEQEQMDFYQNLKREGWQQLTEQLAEAKHSGQKQILLLTALTRLRQACCDPKLLGAQGVPSSKTEYCLQMLRELVAENRAVLVFSQFTSVLDILAQHLQELTLPYLLLTGKSKNRGALVDRFQQGEVPIFLISLKAGGVGLNLTRADTVIHFDPWWNAAAEDQATDRAHRIGQTQPVFVYKLIAQDTIEEKIARLQQAKAHISQQVNHNAQNSGEAFALKLEDLLSLWQEEQTP